MPPRNAKGKKTKKEEEGQELNPIVFKNTPKKHFDDLINDFINQFGEGKYRKEDNSFEFPSLEVAEIFFTAQAKEKREFFARQALPDGKTADPNGKNFFSLGDGKIYTGTLEVIKKDLEAARKNLAATDTATIAKYDKAIGIFSTLISRKDVQIIKEPDPNSPVADADMQQKAQM